MFGIYGKPYVCLDEWCNVDHLKHLVPDVNYGIGKAHQHIRINFGVENHTKTDFFRTQNSDKQILTSKNRKLQIVRNAFSRSFVPIGAKFEGRTDVQSSNFYGQIWTKITSFF